MLRNLVREFAQPLLLLVCIASLAGLIAVIVCGNVFSLPVAATATMGAVLGAINLLTGIASIGVVAGLTVIGIERAMEMRGRAIEVRERLLEARARHSG